jgi:hypothetical protein
LYFSGDKIRRLALPASGAKMKNRLHYILIFTCIATAAFATASYGQDSGMPDYEMTDSERDKMLYSPGGEGELRPRYPVTVTNTPKDSAAFRTAPVTPPARVKPEQPLNKSPEKQQPPKHDDDSILSFNFLYYIIQKYKLQDIID